MRYQRRCSLDADARLLERHKPSGRSILKSAIIFVKNNIKKADACENYLYVPLTIVDSLAIRKSRLPEYLQIISRNASRCIEVQ